VHRDPAAAGDVADDFLSGQRIAALGEVGEQIALALDLDRALAE